MINVNMAKESQWEVAGLCYSRNASVVCFVPSCCFGFTTQTVWAAAFGLLKLFSSFEQTEIGAFLFSGGEVNWLDYKISFFKLWWVGIHSSYSKVRVYDISLSEFLAPEASKLWFNNSSSVHQCTESPCQKKKIRTRTFLKQQFFIIDSSWELVGAVH